MPVLIAIAFKSLLIAGIALGLLALMKRRSAAERSWVAHIGLLALVTLAFAPMVLPSWTVEVPAAFGQIGASKTDVQSSAVPVASVGTPVQATAAKPVTHISPTPRFSISSERSGCCSSPKSISDKPNAAI